MDYSVVAKKLLEQLGGEKNIVQVAHCMTRLRFVLKDESLVNDNAVKKIKGVMGIMKKSGQYQVIIGNDVAKCYKELLKLGTFSNEGAAPVKKEKQNIFAAILDVVSGCMSAMIPAIIGAGMIKVILVLLTTFNLMSDTNSTYQILAALGDATFYFLPMILVISCSKKFNINPYTLAAVVGVMVYPDFIGLVDSGTKLTLFGLPVTPASYSYSVIPVILIAWAMSYIEPFVDKITPAVTKNFLRPLLILLIALPIALVILGPIGYIGGEALSSAIYFIQEKAGWLALMLMAAFMPLLVMTGMHWAFVPFALTSLNAPGYETVLLVAMLSSNLAQGASCLAVSLKTKNNDLKQVATASAVSALLAGVTEPAMYGVTIKLKKPLIACMIAGAIGGLYSGIVALKAYVFATPALISIVQFIDPAGSSNFTHALIVVAISIILGFVLTWIIGFEDEVEEDEVEIEVEQPKTICDATISSPLEGKVVALSQVNDVTFSEELMGKGTAIIPTVGRVVAPFDGCVSALFGTKHAIGLTGDNGVEVLIHIGLDTVKLEGKHFEAHVKTGDQVKAGDLLVEFDIKAIQESGYEVITPVVVTNTNQYTDVLALIDRDVSMNEELMKVMK